MLNINSTIDWDVKSFLRWWLRELSFLIPENIRHSVFDEQGFIIVSTSQDNLILHFSYRGQSELLATLEHNKQGIAHYKTLLDKDTRLPKAKVILRLNAAQAVYTTLSLPVAVKGNQQQVVGYELDKYTPFKAEQVYFAIRQLPESEPGQIAVQVIISPKEHLDSLYYEAKTLGMVPLFADFATLPNQLDDSRGRYNLLPEAFRQKVAKTPQIIYGGLVTALLILLLTSLILPLWMESETIAQLQERVDSIEKEAKKIKKTQAEVSAFAEQTQKLIDHKTALPPMVEMLNELSTLIKDDTSLDYAQYADGHLQILGESPAASGLISVLESSELFANARFVSPVTQDNVSKLERFQITVDVTKRENHGNNLQK